MNQRTHAVGASTPINRQSSTSQRLLSRLALPNCAASFTSVLGKLDGIEDGLEHPAEDRCVHAGAAELKNEVVAGHPNEIVTVPFASNRRVAAYGARLGRDCFCVGAKLLYCRLQVRRWGVDPLN